MDNKIIANYALDFIGGKPNANRYYNSDESKFIDIMECTDTLYENINVYATIGLWNTDIGFETENKPLRAELIAINDADTEVMANVLASAVFEIFDGEEPYHGKIIQSVVKEYVKNSPLEHIILLYPYYWEKYHPIEEDDVVVTWLFAVPISENERKYILEHGIDKFEELMENRNINVWDFNRADVV